MADLVTTPVTDTLNRLLGAYWGAAAQHQTHVALLNAWGLAGLAQSMQLHIDDEPITIQSLTDRLLDLDGRPAFTITKPNIGATLREILDNDMAAQRTARPALNAAAEVAAGSPRRDDPHADRRHPRRRRGSPVLVANRDRPPRPPRRIALRRQPPRPISTPVDVDVGTVTQGRLAAPSSTRPQASDGDRANYLATHESFVTAVSQPEANQLRLQIAPKEFVVLTMQARSVAAPLAIVVVDFSDVNFICASAFRALDECGTYAMRRDHSLVVAYLPAPYARIATLFQWNGAGALDADDYAVVTSIYQDA